MLNQEQLNKLNSYFGFARKKHSLFAGMELEERLSRQKISLLIILPSCSDKNKDKLINRDADDPELKVLNYQGTYDIALASGFKLLKAIGVGDVNLAHAIYEVLSQEEMNGNEKKEETK
ncbi:MAG: hypothetical protein WCR56_05645 [Bacilli bacterium]|mgnify:CR=1 FL=1|jgi:hypothetical protein